MDKIQELYKIESRIQAGSNDINEHLTLGAFYFDNGEFDKLISLYNKTLKLHLSDSDKGRVLYEKGEAFQLINKYEEATESFKEAIKCLKNKTDEWESLYIKGMSSYNLFLSCLDQDKLEQYSEDAIKCFDLILSKHPQHKDIHHVYSSLADIYTRIEKYDKAEYFYAASLNESTSGAAKIQYLSGLASVYGKKSQYSKAAKYYDMALNEAKQSSLNISKICFDMGVTYFLGDYFSEAEKALRMALEHKDSDVYLKSSQEYAIDIYWYLGMIAYEENNNRDAKKYIDRILTVIDSNHFYYSGAHLTLGHICMAIDDLSGAREHYNEVLVSPFADDEQMEIAKDCLSQLPLDS